ncbi:hypothetical protein EXIGLDRAFT_309433 [Exidia glandulosa HHB12029]|uniref:Uncharacterized protein n=1 Tax=Exidia glandulosa HHB12029 TaxID=1314781 RepID=A0A165D1B8_EXIGL|nr:hypothetical protein EXIGLDRAFT_309433 [Exidia glandulosa HHB12029]
MSAALTPYTVALTAPSPMFDYRPYREADAGVGWNASYTQSTVWPIVPANSSDPHIDAPALGVAYRRTHLVGAAVSLAFQGKQRLFCTAISSQHRSQDLRCTCASPAAGPRTASRSTAMRPPRLHFDPPQGRRVNSLEQKPPTSRISSTSVITPRRLRWPRRPQLQMTSSSSAAGLRSAWTLTSVWRRIPRQSLTSSLPFLYQKRGQRQYKN